MKYCTNCGQPAQDDSRFCENCGAPLQDPDYAQSAAAPYPSMPYEDPAPTPDPHHNKQKGIIIALCCALAAVIAIFGTLFYLQSKDGGKPVADAATSEKVSGSDEKAEQPVPKTAGSSEAAKDGDSAKDKASSENKADTKAESKTETKTESKTETKTESQPAPAPKPNSDVQTVTPTPAPAADYTVYRANYVMKVRSEPSLSASQTGRVPEGGRVVIDSTTLINGTDLWGHIQDNGGWICIRDASMNYLSAE